MTLSAVWTSHIPICCQAGIISLDRLMEYLFGAIIIFTCSVETCITVSIRHHKKLARGTQNKLLLIGKEFLIILMLFLGMFQLLSTFV